MKRIHKLQAMDEDKPFVYLPQDFATMLGWGTGDEIEITLSREDGTVTLDRVSVDQSPCGHCGAEPREARFNPDRGEYGLYQAKSVPSDADEKVCVIQDTEDGCWAMWHDPGCPNVLVEEG